MTIAAGFNFEGGVVLCADTKHSASYKVDASKIFTERYDNGAVSAFVYAGNMRYCRMAIEKFESAIASLTQEQATLAMMRGMVEGALRAIHKEHVFVHPRFRAQELSIRFVGSLWSPHGGLYNFSTDDTSIIRFRGYDCIGSGAYLGHYLIRSKYKMRPVPSRWRAFCSSPRVH
jgi:20S proteasome alpha/beta subunit